MIDAGDLYASIDQINGTVSFRDEMERYVTQMYRCVESTNIIMAIVAEMMTVIVALAITIVLL